MAQVGQTTQSGGREWNVHPLSATLRQVTVPVNCTVNHIGAWLREQTAANQNDCRGILLTAAGVLVYETAILTAGISSTSFALYQLNFSGQSLSAGTYIIGVTGGPGSNGVIVQNGQNDTAGSPTNMYSDPVELFPNCPSDVSSYIDTAAARQWDIYLDYTEAAAGSVVNQLLQAHGESFL